MNRDELSFAMLAFVRLQSCLKWPADIPEVYDSYSSYEEDFHTIVGFLEECRNEIHPAVEAEERKRKE